MTTFYHQNDRRGPHDWPFVYLHGQAENFSGASCSQVLGDPQAERGADDIFCCDSPMPTEPGEYLAELYGQPVVAVIDYAGSHFLRGRAALAGDEEALEHCRRPNDWR